MKRSIAQKRFLQNLMRLSKDASGFVSQERVSLVLETLKKSFTDARSLRLILMDYLDQIKAHCFKQQIRIVTADPIDEAILSQIQAHYESRYNRKLERVVTIDANLLTGMQVRVADDVYDFSLRARLKQFARSNNRFSIAP